MSRVDHRQFNGQRRTPDERFWQKVDGGEVDKCWLWTAARDKNGYGWFSHEQGRQMRAHTWIYERLRAEIPVGLQIDHLCYQPSCVNPWHMEPVTTQENLRRRRRVGPRAKSAAA